MALCRIDGDLTEEAVGRRNHPRRQGVLRSKGSSHASRGTYEGLQVGSHGPELTPGPGGLRSSLDGKFSDGKAPSLEQAEGFRETQRVRKDIAAPS